MQKMLVWLGIARAAQYREIHILADYIEVNKRAQIR